MLPPFSIVDSADVIMTSINATVVSVILIGSFITLPSPYLFIGLSSFLPCSPSSDKIFLLSDLNLNHLLSIYLCILSYLKQNLINTS